MSKRMMIPCCFLLIAAAGFWDSHGLTLDDIRNMPANSWLQAPNTPLRAVAPSASQYPGIQAVEGVSAVIDDWCGGILDTRRNRFIVWGGGHNGYFGNEIYAFLIDSLKWRRLNNPTANPSLCADNNGDGSANSRHTYNSLAYITHADRFFAIGGALACPAGSCGANKTWVFNFETLQWQNRAPTGTIPGTCCEDLCAYDPITKKIWFGDAGAWSCGSGKWGLYSYDYDSNVWTKHNSLFYIGAMAVDTRRHVLLNVGQTAASSSVYVTGFDLSLANPPRETWNTTGGAGIITKKGLGLEYDPVADKYVGWAGGAVYALDPDTKAWTAHNAAGGPPTNVYGVTNGVYGRWRYVPGLNAYITVVSVDGNVYFYKLTAGSGIDGQRPAENRDIDISVRPNPFRDRITVSVKGADQDLRVSVYGIEGGKVFEGRGKGALTCSAPALAPGLYLVKVRTAGRTAVKRIVLSR